MKKHVDHFLNLSAYDLETARAMFSTGRYLYVTFMCHQSIEKTLKAIIMSHKELAPPPIHRLPKLAELAKVWKEMDEEKQLFLEKLSPFNLHARYPVDEKEFQTLCSKELCKDILSKTEEMWKWLKQKAK